MNEEVKKDMRTEQEDLNRGHDGLIPKNIIASFMQVIAILMYILGILGTIEIVDADWLSSLIIGSFFLGLSEIIKLLHINLFK